MNGWTWKHECFHYAQKNSQTLGVEPWLLLRSRFIPIRSGFQIPNLNFRFWCRCHAPICGLDGHALRVGLHYGPRPKNLENRASVLIGSIILDPKELPPRFGRWSGADVASLSCQISSIATFGITSHPSLENQSPSLVPSLGPKWLGVCDVYVNSTIIKMKNKVNCFIAWRWLLLMIWHQK